MKIVGRNFKKIDASAITSGKPIYTDDLASPDALIVKVLRSPHAHAVIEEIDVSRAESQPGVALVLTHKDVPQTRFSLAGQSYPEPSPYDQLILDRKVRYVGDAVAIVAAETEAQAENALKRIKVTYRVLEPVLDFETAIDHPSVIHDEAVHFNLPQAVGGQDTSRNLMASYGFSFGQDIETVLNDCDVTLERVYYVQAAAQAMMETFRSYTYLDAQDRLCVITSTQVPFHIKRQLARALEISPARIRVIKPRIGGGFGAKQTSETEIYPAIVTLKTGRPAKIVYTRKETFSSSNSRHAMRITVRLGADQDGRIRAIDIHALSDQGAYGHHGFTTVKLVGEKTLPLYNRLDAAVFSADVVYTNKLKAGAFRGYGATQGTFALESAINELADMLSLDPVELRLKNIVREGETTLAFDKLIESSKLDKCIETGRDMIGWQEKPRKVTLPNGHIRATGMAITMQGSGIANIDSASAIIKLNETGDLSLFISASDNGMGTDTVLVQLAAETLRVSPEDITLIAADTDLTPYDPGSYASSGAYVTGMAVVKACQHLKEQIIESAAAHWQVPPAEVDIKDGAIYHEDTHLDYIDLARVLSVGPAGKTLVGTGSFGHPASPPPYMAGFAEIDYDPKTGLVKVVDYVGVVDCGTVINPPLAQVQVESGIVQGIGYALYEDVVYGPTGQLFTNNFLQYKLPTRPDIPQVRVAFEESYEPSGPYGAKSIGEVVINTSAPAIQSAIHAATGRYLYRLPMKPETILFGEK